MYKHFKLKHLKIIGEKLDEKAEVKQIDSTKFEHQKLISKAATYVKTKHPQGADSLINLSQQYSTHKYTHTHTSTNLYKVFCSP